eukprot:SAG31_NODE_1080_length_10027_cov_8.417204_7_plen_86_part_00
MHLSSACFPLVYLLAAVDLSTIFCCVHLCTWLFTVKDALDMAMEELEEDGEDTDKEFYEDVNLLEHDWILEEVEEEERENEVKSA